ECNLRSGNQNAPVGSCQRASQDSPDSCLGYECESPGDYNATLIKVPKRETRRSVKHFSIRTLGAKAPKLLRNQGENASHNGKFPKWESFRCVKMFAHLRKTQECLKILLNMRVFACVCRSLTL